jgi:NCS1 family nucleobase:cation symporter-1
MVPVLWTHGPGMTIAVQYTWFIGMAVGLGIYLVIGRKAASVPVDAR